MSVDPWMLAAGVAAALVLASRLARGGKVASSVVQAKIAAGASVVDVRSPDEFRGGAYPGAINIPVQVLPARMGELPKDRPVVLYCASGARSAAAARMLKQAGFADVVNAGGLGDMP